MATQTVSAAMQLHRGNASANPHPAIFQITVKLPHEPFEHQITVG